MFGMMLFQIPVYAETRDDYHDWLSKKIAPYGDPSLQRGESRDRGEDLGRRLFGTSSGYNRIVGWIEIRGAHDVIKAYLTWTSQKQIRFERKEAFPFKHEQKVFEQWVHPEMTSAQVYESLNEALIEVAGEPPIKGRWIDRTAFDALGPHVDFPALLGWAHTSSRRGRDARLDLD
jgi:hypothetical protein